MQKYLQRMYVSILILVAAIPLAYFGWLYAEWRSQTGNYYAGVYFGAGVAFILLGIIGSILNWHRYRSHRNRSSQA